MRLSFTRRKNLDYLETATRWQEGIVAPREKKDFVEEKRQWYKYAFLFGGFVLCFSLLLYRLFSLQFFEGRYYRVLAETNRVIVRMAPYERGTIFDRTGEVLARNESVYRAFLVYSQIPPLEDGQYDEWRSRVQGLFGVKSDELAAALDKARQQPFVETPFKSGIDQESFLKFETLSDNISGVYLRPDFQREYPHKEMVSHVLGYTGEITQEELQRVENSGYIVGEQVGRTGIEQFYQSLLKGQYGRQALEVDSLGKTVRLVKEGGAVPGSSLYLSLDLALQKKAHELLIKALEEYTAKSGTVIVQETKTGKILALASLPTYDNNLFAEGIDLVTYQNLIGDEQQPLFNRAIAGIYPPGSTVKPFVGLAAMDEGIITPFTILTDTPQVIEIGGGRFPDWRVSWGRGPLGNITVKEAIAHSSNIFFYKISGGYESQEGLGIKRIKEHLQLFNIAKKTDIDLPGENAGVFPDPAWKLANKNESWYLGDDYQVGIGQGDLLVTPLQMVNAVTALVNNGRLYKPQLLEKIVDHDGKVIEELSPEVISELDYAFSDMQAVREGMREAVTTGIVYPLRTAQISVAAKTGTAEFGVLNEEGEYETHAWVEGFAPYENPEISFVVLLEKGGSSQNSAEVAKQLVDWYFSR